MGFDATCSLSVFSTDTDEPISVTGPNFNNDGDDRNVILWLDHRPVEETEKVNATNHKLLKYVGGKMSIEMEIPKVLWLKNNMPPELFARCKFYDLADALTHIATGNETRSFCSTVCKQGYVPVGVDGSVKGWQEDFYHDIGLGDLVEDNFKRMGGVDGVVSPFPFSIFPGPHSLIPWIIRFFRNVAHSFQVRWLTSSFSRTAYSPVLATVLAPSASKLPTSSVFPKASPSEAVSLMPTLAGLALSEPRSTLAVTS